jgi:hypothetical protein
MDDLLQHIDLDYYRAAQLLIVRAEIAQLRQGLPAPPPVESSHPGEDASQTSCDANAAPLSQLG